MNVVYRVVWNSTTNTWVVASEMAKGRKKKGVSASGATLVAVLASTGGLAVSHDAAAASVNQAYLDLCQGGGGTTYTNTGTGGLGCLGSYGFDLAAGNGYGGYNGWVSLRSQEGYALELHGVGGVSVKDTMTMNYLKITNLANGSNPNDAVNYSQLKAVEAKIGTGTTDPNAVHYDTGTSNGKVTLAGGAAGTTITNVKAGDISSVNSKDAVNGGQLFTTNENVTNVTNNFNTLKSTVDGLLDDALLWSDADTAYSAKHDGTNAKIKNLAAGAVSDISTEAINGSQLFGTAGSVAAALGGGSTVGADGKISMPSYKVNDVATTGGVQGAIEALDARFDTIGPGVDSLNWDKTATAYNAQRDGVDQRITGVAAGANPNDAVNKKQLDDAVDGVSPVLKYIRFGAVSPSEDGLALAQGLRSTAVGAKSIASGADSFAMGYGARATYENSVAIGSGSNAPAANTFAVGSAALKRRIVNVADGTAATDAATVGQVGKMIDAKLTPAAQGTSMLKTTLSSKGLLGATASSKTPAELIVSGPTTLNGATAIGESALAVGLQTVAEGKYAAAIGQNAAASAESAVAVGSNVASIGQNSVVVGSNANTIANNSLVFGIEAKVDDFAAENTIAIGQKVTVAGKDTVALGSNIETLGVNDVILGNGSTDDSRNNIVSVGSAAQRRQIINVANGTQDFDAVNVSQLKTVTAAIGGGSVVGPDGKVTLPTYKIDGKDVTGTLADGISALDLRIIDGGNDPLAAKYDSAAKDTLTLGGLDVDGKPATEPVKLTNVADASERDDAVNLGQLQDAGLFDPDGEVLAVVYDKDSAKATVTFEGADGTVLENVAAGTVSADSKQAVNGSQLFGTAKSVADALGGGSTVTDGKVTAPTFSIGDKTAGTVSDAVDKLDDRIDGVAVATTDALKWDANAAGGAAYSATHGTQATNRITNVAEAKEATDAVNKGQFDRAIRDLSLVADPMSVKYDGTDKTKVTLGGTGATTAVKLTNLAAGTEDPDAVNVKQLKDAGLIAPDGKVFDAVVYDANSQRASVTFGGVNGTTLNNVADGMINRDSRQAVNGGQIFQLKEQLNQQITNIDARVTNIEVNGGGGSLPYIAAVANEEQVPVSVGEAVGAAARIPVAANAGTSPGVAVGYDSVAAGEEASVLGDHASAYAKDSLALGNDASVKASGTNSIALGNGSIASTANTVSIGSAGAERTISNVASGNADTDAVNVSQLRGSLTESKAYTDARLNDVWDGLGQELDQVNRQANRGIAAASALINVTPYVPGHVTVNAGLANYRGETALGVGVSRWSDNGRLNLNAGVSAAKDDDPVIRVGIGYIF